jgi:hypothetical protein
MPTGNRTAQDRTMTSLDHVAAFVARRMRRDVEQLQSLVVRAMLSDPHPQTMDLPYAMRLVLGAGPKIARLPPGTARLSLSANVAFRSREER